MDLGDSLVRSNGPVSIVIDASIIESRSTTEGDWMMCARKVRKGYLKMECT
jgi:hypothetical protein